MSHLKWVESRHKLGYPNAYRAKVRLSVWLNYTSFNIFCMRKSLVRITLQMMQKVFFTLAVKLNKKDQLLNLTRSSLIGSGFVQL